MIQLAWRNVARNRRRSLITTASMGFGLAAIMFGQSMVKTLQAQLVEKATSSITAHIQVQDRRIKEYKFPDRYIAEPDPIETALKNHPRVQAFGRRITITGLVSSPATSVGVLICAVDPEREPKITNMSTYIVEGEFLGKNPRAIVMGDKLARRLDLRLGEKAVVMSQSTDGSMGAELFRVAGITHSGSESFDGQIVYIPVAAAQELLGVGRQVNHFAARVDDLERIDEIRAELSETLTGQGVQVLSWKNVDHEILAIQKFQNALLNVVLAVVFFIVALGILNTLLMSLFERVREFGVLMAMGAKPSWVMKLVVLESLTLGFFGMIFGLAFGSVLIAYFGHSGLHLPIGDALAYFLPFPSTLYLKPSWGHHLFAASSVLLTSFLAALPPALRASRLSPAEALRHV